VIPRPQAIAGLALLALLAVACRPTVVLPAAQAVEIAAREPGANLETTTACEMPACVARCRDGDASSCAAAGRAYAEGDGVNRSARRAHTFYREACEWGHGELCNSLGYAYFHGRGVERDRRSAVAWYAKACEHDVGSGCRAAGLLHHRGAGVEVDLSAAVRYYRRACDLEDADGCAHLGEMHLLGLGVHVNRERGRALLQEACHGGSDIACQNPIWLEQDLD